MNDELRPDPDELLSRIAAEETEAQQKSTRGKLKIFFGACAGVGKTYAMLSAGKQALADGVDVVIGLVETHGREETKKLLEGLPILPTREVQYRSTLIKEFDIDAALTRRPKLILIDELAHSNAPGSRHPKRWQDVEELLEAGIDIYTTINVQHLESLNDVVARITGIWVKETVPDEVFDKADEISLVDIPSEELLKRLKEGKVYIAPEAKKRAAQNFFKKSNLIALRELALRRTAERVDALMESYKTKEGGGAQSWSGADRILVCIGPDKLSSKLVRSAKRMSSGLKAPWTAIYIENDRHYRLSREGQESVERTLRLAERMGSKTEIIHGQQRASEDILAFARANGITKIIVGKTPRPRWREIIQGTLADEIIRGSGEIDVYVVTGDAEDARLLKSSFWLAHTYWRSYLSAPIVAGLGTLAFLPLRNWLDPISFVLVYMIGIVSVALRYGRGPSILATLLSALCLNFFFFTPYYSFKIAEEQHIITFFVIMVTGVIIGTQSARLRAQIILARKREKFTSALFAMSRELSANRGKITLAQVTARHIAEVLDSDVFLWLPDPKGELHTVVAETEADKSLDPVREESVARWAFNHKQNAGLGTDTLPSAQALYVPLAGSSGVVGVIGAIPRDEEVESFGSDQIDLLETFASISASALERASSAELVEQTLVEAESEKLRNILLSSVSHDLRTPLAAITGAASTLLIEGERISEEYKKELLRSVHEEGARLARMVTNLLDVSSLESGSVKLNKELYFIEELIGSALMRVESRLAKHKVVTEVEHGLPLIRMDGLLIEQVLINLFENAAEYTPPGSTITIRAKTVKPDIHIMVSDNGPGIRAGDEEKIFDKFYASERDGSRTGGLGLAICRGIISAHGGKIWAQNKQEGGAQFTFTLPIKSQESE